MSRVSTRAGPEEPSQAVMTEIRRLANPPQDVKRLLTATFYLLGYPKAVAEDWRMISSTMAKYRNFSQLSQGTNSDKVNTAKAKEILQEMNAESVASKSMACTAFYKWCLMRLTQLD